jgi:exodeoxyribonuclease V alpha subunit
MHGGLKIYRGSPAAARNYVEADRLRADDYYLAEGTGVAERYVASPSGSDAAGDWAGAVRSGGTLAGDGYERWVAGLDLGTGAPKGRLRSDGQGVRFVEVVVNGPKTWSLVAAADPVVAAAYDAALERAAREITGWLADHATTRALGRGGGRCRCRSRRSRRW